MASRYSYSKFCVHVLTRLQAHAHSLPGDLRYSVYTIQYAYTYTYVNEILIMGLGHTHTHTHNNNNHTHTHTHTHTLLLWMLSSWTQCHTHTQNIHECRRRSQNIASAVVVRGLLCGNIFMYVCMCFCTHTTYMSAGEEVKTSHLPWLFVGSYVEVYVCMYVCVFAHTQHT